MTIGAREALEKLNSRLNAIGLPPAIEVIGRKFIFVYREGAEGVIQSSVLGTILSINHEFIGEEKNENGDGGEDLTIRTDAKMALVPSGGYESLDNIYFSEGAGWVALTVEGTELRGELVLV